MDNISINTPTDWKEYELLDSGDGMKLERFGTYIVVRPDPRAIWQPTTTLWDTAHAKYIRKSATDGSWDITQTPPDPWVIHYENLAFTLRPTSFKHVGVFPEQATNWRWMKHQIDSSPLKVLNLFAYTGGATMAALSAGAQVTHVDSAKSAINWANENIIASGLKDKPVRWIEEDAYKFVLREAKRGNTYDGVIMDPPRFGRGSSGEVWKIEEDLPKLLTAVKSILSASPKFILLNAYTADLSSLVLRHVLADLTKDMPGTVSFGELALTESGGKRFLPAGIFSRWNSL